MSPNDRFLVKTQNKNIVKPIKQMFHYNYCRIFQSLDRGRGTGEIIFRGRGRPRTAEKKQKYCVQNPE